MYVCGHVNVTVYICMYKYMCLDTNVHGFIKADI